MLVSTSLSKGTQKSHMLEVIVRVSNARSELTSQLCCSRLHALSCFGLDCHCTTASSRQHMDMRTFDGTSYVKDYSYVWVRQQQVLVQQQQREHYQGGPLVLECIMMPATSSVGGPVLAADIKL